jgi:hypothetical protein
VIMVGQGYACFGVIAVLAGLTAAGTARNQADARADELQLLQERESQIKTELISTHEVWRQTMLQWQAAGEVGDPPVLRAAGGSDRLAQIQLRIYELRSLP